MNLSLGDLKQIVDDWYETAGGDVEIRFVTQPNWPLQFNISSEIAALYDVEAMVEQMEDEDRKPYLKCTYCDHVYDGLIEHEPDDTIVLETITQHCQGEVDHPTALKALYFCEAGQVEENPYAPKKVTEQFGW